MKLTWMVLCYIGGASGFQIFGIQPPQIMNSIPRRLCELLTSSSNCYYWRPRSSHQNRVGGPYIEITVSPLVTSEFIRVLDISWNCGDQCSPGDWVALYRKPPVNKNEPSLYEDVVLAEKGWVRTGVQEMREYPRIAQFHSRCLGYWAAYWSLLQDEPVVTTCLMTNPTWMEDIWDDIKHLELNEVFLPGSHDAGSYTLHYKPYNQKKYYKYIYNQDETVLEQLIHGSRYLDLRIAYYESMGYWVNHQIVRTQLLHTILDDILLFLSKTREILIIDLHGFPIGFRGSMDAHEAFLEYLRAYLGEHMAPFTGYDTTLEEIRNSGKRLIVAYNKAKVACRYPSVVWRPVSQRWGNVHDLGELKYFLMQEMINYHRNTMWAAMAELTAGTVDILMDRLDGLRAIADSSNHNVTEWFNDSWGMTANVVAVDFIRSSGIVSAAIKWNVRKGSMKSPKRHHRTNILIRTHDRAVLPEEYKKCLKQVSSENSKQPHPWWDLNVERKLGTKYLYDDDYYTFPDLENPYESKT